MGLPSRRGTSITHSTGVQHANVLRFLFNPFTIATCLGRSTSVVTTTGILYAVSNAVCGNSLNAMLALGFASYLSIYPALLFIPLVILCYDIQVQGAKAPPSAAVFALKHFGILLASVAGLLGISALIIGDFWEFISATYGFQLLVPDLTPNIGLWWYFFIEIFDSFREFFLGVFWLHLAGYVGGLTVRLRRQPLFVVTALLGIFAIFKPYPSLSDASLYFALLPLYRHLFPCKTGLSSNKQQLMMSSDALYVHRQFGSLIRHSPWPRVLSSLDLCRVWKCQLFLRHHSGLESWTLDIAGRFDLRCPQRRMGVGEPRNARQRRQTSVKHHIYDCVS